MKLRILASARNDLDRLHAFLSPKNPEAANRAVDLIYESALSLRDGAGKGRPLKSGFRDLIVPFGKGAYVLRYRINEALGAVVVVRIWPSREKRK